MPCPFCATEKDDDALVCPTCNRDTAVPSSLREEHAELLKKREQLRAELADAKARLTARMRWRKLRNG